MGRRHSCQEETVGVTVILWVSVKEAEKLHEQNNAGIPDGLADYVQHICVL